MRKWRKVMKKKAILNICCMITALSKKAPDPIFAVKDGIVYTQDNQNVLMGITRKKIIDILKSLQITISYEDVFLDNIREFDGFFLSGTSIGVMPVKQIDQLSFDSTQNQLIKSLIMEYNECVKQYIARHNQK